MDQMLKLYELGIVHFDIKPANILIINGKLKLIDFGLSTYFKSNTKLKGRVCKGTLRFMAPELYIQENKPESQTCRTISLREAFLCDLYSLGQTIKYLVQPNFTKMPLLKKIYEEFTRINPWERSVN